MLEDTFQVVIFLYNPIEYPVRRIRDILSRQEYCHIKYGIHFNVIRTLYITLKL